MTTIILYIAVGLTAGVLSGLLGIGGGIVMVPLFIFLFGMSAHMAQGTTLAVMIPPIGLLAALTYYNHGYVNFKIAAFVCVGFFVGGLFGAKVANVIPEDMLRKIFGIVMLVFSIKMIIGK